MTAVFWRDGFVDRYSGEPLIFPGTLRVLGAVLPEEFPANGKISARHIVYWQLFPTMDHLVPVSRGGRDDESNWVRTSMLRNSAKAHWTLQELGWTLQPPGSAEAWDGLTRWFIDYTEARPELILDAYVKRWRRAAVRVHGSPRPRAFAVSTDELMGEFHGQGAVLAGARGLATAQPQRAPPTTGRCPSAGTV